MSNPFSILDDIDDIDDIINDDVNNVNNVNNVIDHSSKSKTNKIKRKSKRSKPNLQIQIPQRQIPLGRFPRKCIYKWGDITDDMDIFS